jgi:hypothetical protein
MSIFAFHYQIPHRKYQRSPSTTDFKEFAERTHFIVGQRNREEAADRNPCLAGRKGSLMNYA